jgi:hypothetical protein
MMPSEHSTLEAAANRARFELAFVKTPDLRAAVDGASPLSPRASYEWDDASGRYRGPLMHAAWHGFTAGCRRAASLPRELAVDLDQLARAIDHARIFAGSASRIMTTLTNDSDGRIAQRGAAAGALREIAHARRALVDARRPLIKWRTPLLCHYTDFQRWVTSNALTSVRLDSLDTDSLRHSDRITEALWQGWLAAGGDSQEPERQARALQPALFALGGLVDSLAQTALSLANESEPFTEQLRATQRAAVVVAHYQAHQFPGTADGLGARPSPASDAPHAQ